MSVTAPEAEAEAAEDAAVAVEVLEEIASRLDEAGPKRLGVAVSGGGDMLKESFLPVAGALGAVMTLQKPVDINEFCAAVSSLAAA